MLISYKGLNSSGSISGGSTFVVKNLESYHAAAAWFFGKNFQPEHDGPFNGLPTVFPAVVTFYGCPTTTHEPGVHSQTLEDYRKKLLAKLEEVKEF